MEKNNANSGIIILAAGGSARLGRPKQLLAYNGSTLLQHSVGVALATGAHPVVVVLGAGIERVQAVLNNDSVQVVENSDWQEGMASSIRCGLQTLTSINPLANGFILMVCDQPFVTASLLNELLAAHQETGQPVVASGYEETYGPPVFFHRSLFAELLQLRGDVGARGVVRQHAGAVAVIPFPEGTIDVDTEADYEQIKSNANHDKGQL